MKILFLIATLLWAPNVWADGPILMGDMQKLKTFDPAQEVSELLMDGVEDRQYFLSDFGGKIVVLNLWATWCPPCIKELPSLDALQGKMGGDDFEVVAISLDGDTTAEEIQSFLNEEGLKHLKPIIDHESSTSYLPNLNGLPTTYILNEQGNMLARFEGDTNWMSNEALTVIEYYLKDLRAKTASDTDEGEEDTAS